MSGTIEVWLSVGSTYTYLTVMRIEAVAARAGVALAWRPFSVRTLIVEQDNVPFRDKPLKAAYMWRDIARRAAGYGLSPLLPAPYPLTQWDLVNRIAVLAAREGWCGAYLRETYARWFDEGLEPGLDPQLGQVLRAVGRDEAEVLAAAGSGDIGQAYEAATDQARRLGIFGSPTFAVGGELFWGDDRLEDALQWARTGRLDLGRDAGIVRPDGG